MSESLEKRLSHFTPDGTGLDRDALLFAAGRASARPKRLWPVLAGVLAISQLLSLTLMWPRTTSHVAPLASAPKEPALAEPLDTAQSRLPTELWSHNNQILQSEGYDLPSTATPESMVPGKEPFQPLSALPKEFLE